MPQETAPTTLPASLWLQAMPLERPQTPCWTNEREKSSLGSFHCAPPVWVTDIFESAARMMRLGSTVLWKILWALLSISLLPQEMWVKLLPPSSLRWRPTPSLMAQMRWGAADSMERELTWPDIGSIFVKSEPALRET